MTEQQDSKKRQLILDLAVKYKYNQKHAAFVEKASLKLFDSLKSIHKLGTAERTLLSHASLIHDIGSFINEKGHNKHTKYLIEKDELLYECPETERRLLALIACNHRKKIHKDTFKLEKPERTVVLILSSLLRIADSLYYNNDEVNIKSVTTESAEIKISVEGVLPERLNGKFTEKKDLCLEVFGIDINLI